MKAKFFSVITMVVAILLPQIAVPCTVFMLRTQQGSGVSARTVEFGTLFPMQLVMVPRGFQYVGNTPLGSGKEWVGKYAAVGMIIEGHPGFIDGLNEKGLSIGALFFPNYAQYSEITAENQKKALSMTEFSNWVLSNFETIGQVREAIENGDVVIAPTLIEGWPPEPQPFHYIVSDKTGNSLVIEPIDGELVLHDSKIGTLTNSPSYDWHLTNLRNYVFLNPLNVPPVIVDGKAITAFGAGSGMKGLPGDTTPPSRFVRAAVFSATATPKSTIEETILEAIHIQNNFDIPPGSVREDLAEGHIGFDRTLLSTIRDHEGLRYYWRTFDDQTMQYLDLNELDLNAKDMKYLSVGGKQSYVNSSSMLK